MFDSLKEDLPPEEKKKSLLGEDHCFLFFGGGRFY